MSQDKDNFYDKTIDGIDMSVMFKFSKDYFEDEAADVTFEIGTAVMLQWKKTTGKDTTYNMHSQLPTGYSDGISMIHGNLVFRVILEDAIATIGRKLLDKNVNTIKTGKLERYRQSPFIGIKDLEVIKAEDKASKESSEFDLKNFKWNDLPFFDIILVANVDNNDKNSRSEMSIENIKVQSYGSSEGVDSTEMNEMVKFIALGELIPFAKKTV